MLRPLTIRELIKRLKWVDPGFFWYYYKSRGRGAFMHEDMDGKGHAESAPAHASKGDGTEIRKPHVGVVLKRFRVPVRLCTAKKAEAQGDIRREWLKAWGRES